MNIFTDEFKYEARAFKRSCIETSIVLFLTVVIPIGFFEILVQSCANNISSRHHGELAAVLSIIQLLLVTCNFYIFFGFYIQESPRLKKVLTTVWKFLTKKRKGYGHTIWFNFWFILLTGINGWSAFHDKSLFAAVVFGWLASYILFENINAWMREKDGEFYTNMESFQNNILKSYREELSIYKKYHDDVSEKVIALETEVDKYREIIKRMKAKKKGGKNKG